MENPELLINWMRTQLAHDERTAVEASGSADSPAVAERWQWVRPEDDAVIALNPAEDEHVGGLGTTRVSLRSVETYPCRIPLLGGAVKNDNLPTFILWEADEVRTEVGIFITTWDPARVVAETNAKRAIVEAYAAGLEHNTRAWAAYSAWAEGKPVARGELLHQVETGGLERAVRILTAVYADRPGWREEWRARPDVGGD